MYPHVLNDTKHNEIDNSIFTHKSEGENQIWLRLQSTNYYRHPNAMQQKWVLLQISVIKFQNDFNFPWTFH